MIPTAKTPPAAPHRASFGPVAAGPALVPVARAVRLGALLAAALASAALSACGGPLDGLDEGAAQGADDAIQARGSTTGGTSVSPTITFSPATVVAGQATTVTVTLGFSASGGVDVPVSFPTTALAGPRVVRVGGGQRSASFTLYANPYLAAPVAATVTARTTSPNPGTSRSAVLSVVPSSPPAAGAAPRVASVLLGATSVTSGAAVAGLVTLTSPAPAGGLAVQVAISGDLLMSNVSVPSVVVVPAGATFAPFDARTHLAYAGVSAWTDYVVANVYGSAFAGAALTVTR